ncbi:single-stranded-DNA-specific exonuclease RecJ [Proteiniborus sp.]|uniref:single-stranded-DNA-specific exonuclease RecJ n=1 Tax=Proteiniborus sp. TaxID=2079015 RepID=UPI00331C1B45
MIKFSSLVKIAESDNSAVEKLSKALNISRLTSKVMINRGIIDIEEVEEFLNPNIEDFLDPFLLMDMDIAVDRIIEAIHKGENIWIYGDYDVDGVTSTSILILYLKTLCENVQFYIPDRMTEGYGLNNEAIDYIKGNGGELIISVDCGIKSFDVAEYCRAIGIDLIITDHHTCDEELPKALAVINPNRLDSDYPFKKLAGVGVALKLIQALALKIDTKIDYRNILPIVAIGTVADVVSLTGENRIIVKNGLYMIKYTDNQGVNALLEVTGLGNKEINSGHIGFVIGPRINATGRIGMAKYAVHLFTTKNYNEAMRLANMLDEENIKRQNIEAKILEEAEYIINKEVDLDKDKILVIASENWHSGVIGIVSSRITEKYHRPSILISIEGDEGRGSARSISSFDLYENLSKCKDLLIKFGGHRQAAGLTIKKDEIDKFRKRINNIADEILDEIDLVPQSIVDAEIDIEEVILDSAKELKLLEPFGINNPSPIFLLRGILIKAIRPIGKDGKHLKLTIMKADQYVDCIGFNFGSYYNDLKIGQKIDLVVSIDINDFLGQQSVQLIIRDIITSYKEKLEKSGGYINSLLSILEGIDKKNDFCSNNVIIKNQSDDERTSYIINTIKENDSILIIINNIFNLGKLLNTMQYEGRDLVKKVGISYNAPIEHKSCDIIINPTLNRLNMKNYKKVILYDMCFNESYLMEIIDFFKHVTVQVQVVESDFTNNRFLIEYILPKIDDIRLIYKTFISRKEEYLRIETDKYLNSLADKTNNNINRLKLLTILVILKKAELLDYTIKNEFLFVKMFSMPNNKIDMYRVTVYEKLNGALAEIFNLKTALNFLTKLEEEA